jgi:dipeptidyl-peptidase-4
MKYFVRALSTLLCFFLLHALPAQDLIKLEDIWASNVFSAQYVPGFNFQLDGRHYTRQEGNKVVQYDLTTGQSTAVLLDASELEGQAGFSGQLRGYSFSNDESKMLISSEVESIYRRSRKGYFFVWDGEQLQAIYPEGKISYATFNPQADKVAFVFENNVYLKDLESGAITAITEDGKTNQIINGAADWVYEEEFAFAQAFAWAPDGNTIAYYKFDESKVQEFTMTNYRDDLYPEYVTFKYPKVGELNSVVSIHLYNLTTGTTQKVDVGPEKDQYIPRIKWTQDPNQLCVFRMNRHQNKLELLLANASTGATSVLLTETNPYYIDIHDNLTFLKNGQQFVWTSEQDGWNHVYLYDMKGNLIRQVTEGEWEVTEFYGVDEDNGVIYYQSTEPSPLQRDLYKINLLGKGKRKLNKSDGWNGAQFSSTFDYYVESHSTANSPASYTVYNQKGKLIRVIEDNKDLRQVQKDYAVGPVEFFDFETNQGVQLNGYMIKPKDFSPDQEYPVLMFLYGGPGSQQVTDSWGGRYYWWFQMLAQQGFVVACVDNRGTGGRGQEFKKMTYLQLGKFETIDQVEAARHLGSLPFVDKDRIGIFGWSYGGYMSSLCLLKGNDVFKAAIAVAPVTNWKWYDTIYTERYMRDEKENAEGYRDNSPVYFADRLKGNYLLVHGMGDDNVHFQHTAEMANALVAANKQFDTYFYPNRNHGIYGGYTRLHLFTKMTQFLDEKLKNDHSPVGE